MASTGPAQAARVRPRTAKRTRLIPQLASKDDPLQSIHRDAERTQLVFAAEPVDGAVGAKRSVDHLVVDEDNAYVCALCVDLDDIDRLDRIECDGLSTTKMKLGVVVGRLTEILGEERGRGPITRRDHDGGTLRGLLGGLRYGVGDRHRRAGRRRTCSLGRGTCCLSRSDGCRGLYGLRLASSQRPRTAGDPRSVR